MNPDRGAAIARGMLLATIDAAILREDLIEAYQDARTTYVAEPPQYFWVSLNMACLKLRDRTRVVKYHREDCRHFGVPDDDRYPVDPQQIDVRGYLACEFCQDLSITEWCLRIDLDPSNVAAIMRGDKTRVRKRNAIKMFRAIGQEPHPSLLEYVSSR